MKKEIITKHDPKSPIAEVFRTLRTNLQFMNVAEQVTSILITSTAQGEGKSLVSSNLAVAFAQSGKKVLLIDSDLRRGRLAKLFELPFTLGLSNYLSGVDNKGKETNMDLESYIRQTEVPNLHVIVSGSIPPNPSELLLSEKMEELMEYAKLRYDVILLDGTPGIIVTDAVILSKLVDYSLLVTACHKTKAENLMKLKKDLEDVGGKIAGVVVNKVKVSAKKYENSYYYGSKENIKEK